MKSFLLALLCQVVMVLHVHAQGESMQNPIVVSGAAQYELRGEVDHNTTTWFMIESKVFAEADLLTLSLSGGNYGDITFLQNEGTDVLETVFVGGNNNSTVNRLWHAQDGNLYVSITQDNAGGKASFAFSVAAPGVVRDNALDVVRGANTINTELSEVWCRYTATEDRLVMLSSDDAYVGHVVDADGRYVCFQSMLQMGFRLQPGQTVYFPLSGVGERHVSIELKDFEPGQYSDYPLDITGLNEFSVSLAADPSASSDNGGSQSELYWQYDADRTGFLMWGTADAEWIRGMWGCTVRDLTTGRVLNTPKTAVQAGMLTYTISVEAGHRYMIAQTVAYTAARNVTVYTTYLAPEKGDTRDNPIELSLNTEQNMGRVVANTRYYSFVAPLEGMYTATVHAGGQVRATTPHDGSWNIARDYQIQDRQMHIDDEIYLAQGDMLLLEVTLTSDIDIHVDGSDSAVPDYYILITSNGQVPIQDVREGEDIEHAFAAEPGKQYSIMGNGDENYYDQYYRVEVPAGATLVVTTSHQASVGSPACINFTLDGVKWNQVKYQSEMLLSEDGTKKVGRCYTVEPTDTDRVIYVETDGVSFLYEGITWHYAIEGGMSDIVVLPGAAAHYGAAVYTLDGRIAKRQPAHGIYISNGKKVLVR